MLFMKNLRNILTKKGAFRGNGVAVKLIFKLDHNLQTAKTMECLREKTQTIN